MRLLIDDVLDLLRLRVKPLEVYQYPWWQPALLLTLLGLVASADTAELGDNIAGRMVYMVLFTWLETLCFVKFMGVWLKIAKWQATGSLFGLVVVASGVQLLEPLASWLPDDVATVVNMGLAVFGVMVLVHALAQVSSVSRLRVACGVLCFAPVAMLLLAATLSFASVAGWVSLPPDMVSSMQGQGDAGVGDQD